jgi:hypothetical protein
MAMIAEFVSSAAAVSWTSAVLRFATSKLAPMRIRLALPFRLGFITGVLLFGGLAALPGKPERPVDMVAVWSEPAELLTTPQDLNWMSDSRDVGLRDIRADALNSAPTPAETQL